MKSCFLVVIMAGKTKRHFEHAFFADLGLAKRIDLRAPARLARVVLHADRRADLVREQIVALS